MTAREIVTITARNALPAGSPLPFREINGARFVNSSTVTANVTMFDGLPAVMRLTKWSMGYSMGWDSLSGGDIELHDGVWRRVDQQQRMQA